MPRKIRQPKSDLRKAGFVELPDRAKGSHSWWAFRGVPGAVVNLAGADGDDAQRYQERDVREAIAKVRQATAPSE
jgi:hypothetical protein